MNYRLDIQGLRAVAIIAVFIFHLNPRWLPGGFIGVDIFFVISGYLITQILLNARHQNNFASVFYKRRIIRLFPAYFLMLLVCSICAYLFLFPKETVNYSHSLLSAISYLSNIYFSAHINYLTPDTHLLPLLHTWSLSAEAQCYLVYPLVFNFIVKSRFLKPITIIIALWVVMFLLNLVLTNYNQDIAFFSPIVRFQQFLTGALLVFLPDRYTKNKPLSHGSLLLGTILVVIGFTEINLLSHYPGSLSLLPTFGAALIIFSGIANPLTLAWPISNKPMVFLGTISYSLYLWHWPTIVFYKIAISPVLSSYDYILIILTSLLLAWCSWQIAEKRLKLELRKKSTKTIFTTAITASAFLFATSMFSIISDGLKHRFTAQQIYFAETDFSQKHEKPSITDSCMVYKNWIESFSEEKCIHIDPGKTNVLLLGDSHAEHFRRALESFDTEVSVSTATVSACRPTLPTLGRKTCVEMMDRVYSNLIQNYDFDIVFISARWSNKVIQHMPDSIQLLKGNIERVIVVGPIISYAYSLPKLMARYGTKLEKATSIKKIRYYDSTAEIDSKLQKIARDNGAEYISLLDLICPGSVCQTVTGKGTPLQWDYGHLTYDGAVELIQKMKIL